MARLFIRHEPVVATVTPHKGVIGVFMLDAYHVREIECTYICFVCDGVCWAGRKMRYFNSGAKASISCVDFSDNHVGRLMLMKDMLLNH